MQKRLLSFIVLILTAISSPANAQSNIKTPEGKFIFDQASKLLGESQAYISRNYNSSKSLLDESSTEINQKKSALTKANKEQETIIANIESQLAKAFLELYSADTKLAIIPEIVGINKGLLDMTAFYKEQAELVLGEETLSAGPGHQYFQKRRDTIALMIDQLQKELLNIRSIVVERRQNIEKIRDELITLAANPSSKIIELGFSHFINLRISLLDNQDAILSDISSINQSTDLDGVNNPIINNCFPFSRRFTDFLNQNNLLLAYTEPWSSGINNQISFDVSKWISQRTSQSNSARASLKDIEGMFAGFTNSNGIYQPGELDNWNSCIITKTNIYSDLKTKIATEITRGNIESAIQLELFANDLAVEINRLKGQNTRLQQLKQNYSEIGSIATRNSFLLDNSTLMPNDWKRAVRSQIRNLERLVSVEKLALLSARKLTRLAEQEIKTLAGLSTPEQFQASLFPVSSRLDAIVKEGFSRLELELSAAADSLKVMSLNIASAEGRTNEGGLGEAILTYEKIVSIRNTQMQNEAALVLPQGKVNAEVKVQQTQKLRLEALALRQSVKQKLDSLLALESQFKLVLVQFNKFFAVSTSHPVYVSIANKFISEVNPSKKSKAEVSKALTDYVLRFKTIGSISAKNTVKLCTGKNKGPCKKVQKGAIGKKALKLVKVYLRNIPSLIDGGTVVLLGQNSLSGLAAVIVRIRTEVGAL